MARNVVVPIDMTCHSDDTYTAVKRRMMGCTTLGVGKKPSATRGVMPVTIQPLRIRWRRSRKHRCASAGILEIYHVQQRGLIRTHIGERARGHAPAGLQGQQKHAEADSPRQDKGPKDRAHIPRILREPEAVRGGLNGDPEEQHPGND